MAKTPRRTDGPKPSARTLTDPGTLRALSHPVRLSLLEALLSGPLTATEAGEVIDETPTTCSFHLRQLAKYGFVEEVGGGKGRARPWRLTHSGWSAPAQPDNPEFTRASQALDEVLLDRYFERLRRAVAAAPSYSSEWQQAMTGSQNMLHLTAEELAEVTAAYGELAQKFFDRWRERNHDVSLRPEGSLPVETLFFAMPVDRPGGAS